MDWSVTGTPLIAARAVHFAATAMTVGALIFDAAIAGPLLHSRGLPAISFRSRIRLSIWASFVGALISGAIWLSLQAAAMSGTPLFQALSTDVLWTVVTDTQFGTVMTVRAALAVCLMLCLLNDRRVLAQRLTLLTAAGFAGGIAWIGHAGSTDGMTGYLHLAADVLHLLATSAWIGGLAALILFLANKELREHLSLVRDAVGRFSTLGMVSVAALMLSGTVNAVILVGSLQGFVVTEYGRVLMLKLALFALMLAFAAINRVWLTSRLASLSVVRRADAAHQLIRNTAIELVLGFGIIAIVGLLGILHPAVHMIDLATAW